MNGNENMQNIFLKLFDNIEWNEMSQRHECIGKHTLTEAEFSRKLHSIKLNKEMIEIYITV